ncbi:MAG: hypothetical protein NC320_08660 [Clostridium sp.]|nr:hypothetical protein [Clostridium sp.]MCM1547884.1 hypothetical protein [Ruminococcus sp.]
MKKNVFSRAMAVLASMAVLGAASMMTASAEGKTLTVGSATVEPGTTEVDVDVTVNGVNSQGCEFSLTTNAGDPISFDEGDVSKALLPSGSSTDADGCYVICTNANGYKEGAAVASITVHIDADAAPGEYPININVVTLDDGGTPAEDATGISGVITIAEPETEAPEETEAPTDAPVVTEAPAVVTVAATTTTVKKTNKAPATGDLGVAVAVAGLVTAGATAVVLKKRH